MEKFTPHGYQKKAIKHILEHKRAGLFLDMGLGKTVITLTAIEKLIYDYMAVYKVLIIAPLRVAEDTWTSESAKWEHLKHLRIVKVLGNEKERFRALRQPGDIYIINRENVAWLVSKKRFDFDTVVIDELTSFKNHRSQRFLALKHKIASCKRVIGLTGTPAPNGLIDLWAQMYLLDGGARLGKTLTSYRENYFVPDKRGGSVIFSYRLKDKADKAIYNSISDICLTLGAKDLIELPTRIDNTVYITFSETERLAYEKFEREQYMEFTNAIVTAATKAVLINKLLQFCNGGMYTEDGGSVEYGTKKIDALKDIIDANNGKPILCFYSYKIDYERITRHFKDTRRLESEKDIKDWNDGKIPLLLAHPASCGYGLNLQAGGATIVWYGLTWSLEQYQQANARVYRQGQKERVVIHHLIMKGSVEERVLKVLLGKQEVQNSMLEYLERKYKE